MKLYILPVKWQNTANNHAGMYYLAKKIQEYSGLKCKIYSINPNYYHHLNKLKLGFIYKVYYWILSLFMYFMVESDDIVLFMEYFLPAFDQSIIAKRLKGRCRSIAIAHLVPSLIEKYYTSEQMRIESNYVDKILVLGDTLRDYFIGQGISANKVITTFHYVDSTYYAPLGDSQNTTPFQVLCVGSMVRSYDVLRSIIKGLPHINFVVCGNANQVEEIMSDLNNVTIPGYLDEKQLKSLMQQSQVSLNVMKDTIGSNAITTSLACGMAVVASNVGSIANYIVNDENGLLFNSPEEAIYLIEKLQRNPNKLEYIKKQARISAENLDYKKFINWLKKDLLNIKD